MVDAKVIAAGLILAVSASTSLAKDDRPNARKLALDHPWHARVASLTAITVTCGKEVRRYELRIDDRGWLHLVGAEWEALSAPFGRFLRRGGVWRAMGEAEWLSPRDHRLSLRELVGAPILPESWHIDHVTDSQGGKVRVTATDPEGRGHTLTHDVIEGIWTDERLDEVELLRVTAAQHLKTEVLPRSVAVAGGCVLERAARLGTPSMPPREALRPG